MFEQQESRAVRPVWKILPIAVVIFVAVALGINYLNRSDRVELEALVGVVRTGDPDYGWYRKYVDLKDPKIQMAVNRAGGRVVALSGLISNGGEKDLDVVELKVVFFNYEEPVWEMIRTPIRPSPRSPGIPSLTERGFAFYIHEIPEGWLASHAEMSIHGFRFQEGR